MHTFDLGIGEIAKIEGKASLKVVVKDDVIETCQFSISEFKRFYTQAVRGRDVLAIPQLTARICGTCSNAHLLCGIKAAEYALGITPSTQTILLRKLLNYGLIIRDHALHLYVFVLPDILGIDSILDLDENDPKQHELLDDTFIMKAAGNALSVVVGGRSVHAPMPAVGGFAMLPKQEEFPKLIEQLMKARPSVLRAIKLFKDCSFTLNRDLEFVSMVSNDFNFLDGDVKTSGGKVIRVEEYGDAMEHVSIPYSHASGYQLMAKPYMVGALARLNLAKETLHPKTREDAKDALALFPSKNVYHNNLAQAIEILHAIDSSIDIMQKLVIVPEKIPMIPRKAGVGYAYIEAPRGMLFYKLTIDESGKTQDIQILVPTGQNQIGIEKSIYEFLQPNLDKDKEVLIQEIEQIVRAYDPCMSCASHFLKVRWKRS